MGVEGGVEYKARKKRRRYKRRSQSSQLSSVIPQNQQIPKRTGCEVVSKSSNASTSSSKNYSFLDKMRDRLWRAVQNVEREIIYLLVRTVFSLYSSLQSHGTIIGGNEALKFFREDPTLFDVYHAGYQEQMAHWPEQPVNIIIKWLRNKSSSLIVADFGCGDARLARNVKNRVFSMDLVSSDPSIIACDMSNTPLDSLSVDVAVFCLSLMGTNFPNYLEEAHRVLKPSGWLVIAEVKSRFDPHNGGADPDHFIRAIDGLGFTVVSKDFTNKMFILFFFQKKDKPSNKRKHIDWPELKPCLYKRR